MVDIFLKISHNPFHQNSLRKQKALRLIECDSAFQPIEKTVKLNAFYFILQISVTMTFDKSVLKKLDVFTVAFRPKLFKIIKHSRLVVEHVHHDRAVIDDRPFAVPQSVASYG